MKTQTVKRRIFISNAMMVGVVLLLTILINVCIVKIYWEAMEHEWQFSMESMVDSGSVEDLLEEWTVHQQSFYVLILIDALICIVVLILVSSVFAGSLAGYIRHPLDALQRGVGRIRKNVLTEDICYHGDAEFESICNTFNEMQQHLLEEQRKNRRYEVARTEMIAGISHDLRTPLTAIRGTIQGLLDGVVSEPQQQEKFLRTAYRRTGDMEELLNQLLYVSRLETGNLPIHIQQVDLSVFLGEYIEEKRLLAEQMPVQFMTETEDTHVWVDMDPEQMHRVLDNLLENSRKYSEAEPLQICVSLKRTGQGAILRFADNGVGVPESRLTSIFDEFYRIDESRNKKDGNGLGLYIVKELAEAMGGTVHAANENGLAIYVELRRQEEENV